MRRTLLIVEARHPDGSLNLKGEQPPHEWIPGVDEDTLAKWYYRLHPDGPNVTMETVYAYLKTRGWHVRPKTW